jgi:hypothetical protein
MSCCHEIALNDHVEDRENGMRDGVTGKRD